MLKESDEASLDLAMLNILDQLQFCLSKKGSRIGVYSPHSINKLLQMEYSELENLKKHLSCFLNIVERFDFNLQEDEFLSQSDEVECLKHAFDEYGLCFGDEEFGFISQGDIVELYNLENIQIYRNLEFLKVAPYDLATILSSKWTDLYERPSDITQAIATRVGEILSSNVIKASPFNVPIHPMKAVSNAEQVVVEINLKFIKPVFDRVTKEKRGFVATQMGSPILLSGDETLKLAMIGKV